MDIIMAFGASSKMAEELIKLIIKNEKIDEIWALSRSGACDVRDVKIRSFKLNLKDGLSKEAMTALEEEKPNIKWLLNFQGIGFIGRFEDIGIDDSKDTVKLNCISPLDAIYSSLPFMNEGARIVNAASASAFCPQPDFAVYAASKAFLLSFSRALNLELKKRKISVSAICPGPVKTDFFNGAEKYRKINEKKKRYMMSPEKAAKSAYKNALKRKDKITVGYKMAFAEFFSYILPKKLLMRFFI